MRWKESTSRSPDAALPGRPCFQGDGRRALSLLPVWLGLLLATACAPPVDPDGDTAALLALHQRVLDAHLNGDAEAWLAIEGEPYVSANGGTVTFPTAEDRRAWREPYLRSTTFTAYRDLRAPVVRISDDGTLGWIVVEVEVRGTRTSEGTDVPIDAIWAWIELYEKRSGVWRLVGNVSNRRP